MKIGILTFYFAHNYGAMLQTYALKEYLKELGNDVDVVPFFPDHLKQGYSVSPFDKGISLKHRIYNGLTYLKRSKQAKRFENFKKSLITDSEFNDPQKISKYLDKYDLVICGSDQIWNDDITGDTNVYYGADTISKRVAYAASLGKKKLNSTQIKYLKNYISKFSKVSVREESARELLKEFSNDISVVCDPVFLLKADAWKRIERAIDIKGEYLLLYLLEDNDELIFAAKKYASEHNLSIYEIHPMLGLSHRGAKQLRNVGPLEFIYLIRNAKAVCTNSFHAVSFCIIFNNVLIHIPNHNSPERTQNVLSKAGVELSESLVYNLDNAIIEMNDYIMASKDFLEDSI